MSAVKGYSLAEMREAVGVYNAKMGLGIATLDSGGDVVEPIAAGGSVGLLPKVIEIGIWDMDATAQVSVAHGLTVSDIRSITAVIILDASANRYDINVDDSTGTGTAGISLTPTNVVLDRKSGGFFDNTSFDSTAASRGQLVIWYEAP